MIGSAIFIVPAEITREVGSARAAVGVWAAAGVLSLCGALSFAELAAMMPQAGGQYVYLREAYGPQVSFLCGWMFFLVQNSGGIATLAVGFAKFLGGVHPLPAWEQKAAAVVAVLALTGINYSGVRKGGGVQLIFTGLNAGAIVALIVLGWVLGRASPGPAGSLPHPSGLAFLSAFGVAMVAAFWAYEGWNNVTFAAGEVKRPERTLPRALILGTLFVVIVYVLINLVYYRVLSVTEVANSPLVAADAAVRILGSRGSRLVSLAIIIAVLGSTNGSILAGARVYYAMAKDGLFFRWCGAVHPRFHTPHLSLVVQGVWSAFLVLLAGYEQLFTFTVFAAFIFYALAAYAVIVLRRKRPDLPRPYRVPGYPLVPLIFVLGAAWFLMNTLVEKPLESGAGCLIVALGVPVYRLWKR